MNIFVIGAGVAGMTCARMLQRTGKRVTIFEASDSVGGRVRSDFYQEYILDRGFQVLFNRYPALQRQLDYTKLALCAFDPGAVVCFGGQRAVLTDPLRDRSPVDVVAAALSTSISPLDKLRTLALALEVRSQSIDDLLAGDDCSSEEFLRARGFGSTAIDRFFRPFYGGIFLDRSLQTSAKCLRFDFKMLSEGATSVPAKGIQALSDQLAEELRMSGALQLNTAVRALLSDGDRVSGVRLADGSEHQADLVVLATDAPTAAHLSGLDLPREHVSTVTLYFSGDAPLYRGKKLLLNAEPDAFVNNAVLLTNVAPSYAPPGKHLLSATVLGNPALDDDELFARAFADLRRMFAGDHTALRTLNNYRPLKLYRIPYAQFAQPPGLHPNLPDNRSARPGLFFAAEFTEASSLNAAMISGEKCAEMIMMG